jgi:hypothetical protein
MKVHSKLTFGLIALVLSSSAADAQSSAWNRRVSDVHIVHPPGSPPGMWRMNATIGIEDHGTVPGIDLSCDATLSINGMPFEVVTNPIVARSTVCGGAGCLGNCSFTWNGLPISGACSGIVLDCRCGFGIIPVFQDFPANNNFIINVRVTSAPGSAGELDTSDDSMSVVVVDNNPGTLTCAGDGTSAACPCANSGASSHGCANSSNPIGAELSATGFVEADLLTGNDSVVLHVTGMPAGAPLLFFQGTSNALNIAFGDGTLCTSGSIIRLRVKINVGGASQFPEPGDPSVSATGGITLGSGATRYYQAYYRDAGPFCTPNTFNMTNGISLTWY